MKTTFIHTSFVLFLTSFVGFIFGNEIHTWNKTDGTRIDANLVTITNEFVLLKSLDDVETKINIKDLSKKDKDYIKDLELFTGLKFSHINNMPNIDKIKKRIGEKTKKTVPYPILFIITDIGYDSPAEKIGIKKGNAFSLVDNKSFRTDEELIKYLKNKKDSTVTILLWSEEAKEITSKKITLNCVFETRKNIELSYGEEDIEKELGITIADNKKWENLTLGLVAKSYDHGSRPLGLITFVKNEDINDDLQLLLLSKRPVHYGMLYKYVKSEYSDPAYFVAINLHNKTKKAITQVAFQLNIVNPNRSTPYGSLRLYTGISGGIEPNEIKQVLATTLDSNNNSIFIPETLDERKGIEYRLKIKGILYHDDNISGNMK